jgi:hypothetical protein
VYIHFLNQPWTVNPHRKSQHFFRLNKYEKWWQVGHIVELSIPKPWGHTALLCMGARLREDFGWVMREQSIICLDFPKVKKKKNEMGLRINN